MKSALNMVPRDDVFRISLIVTSLKYSNAICTLTKQGVAMLTEKEMR